MSKSQVHPETETTPGAVRQEGRFKSILRLMRIPNIFTAIADVLVGFIFVHQSFEPQLGLLFLVLTSCCLYSAGMILNDVFDVEIDLRDRPDRPIPSGAIPFGLAAGLGFGLLLAGLVFSFLAYSFGHPVDRTSLWFGHEPFLIATCLIVVILLYNKILKKTPLAPPLMGSCRFFNILLGMSLAGKESENLLPAGLIIAGGMGVYIAGVTWFARSETRESGRGLLAFGLLTMILGLAGIAGLPFYGLDLPGTVNPLKVWLLPFVMILFAYSLIRFALRAIADPIPTNVQLTIKQCLLSIILIHAGIVFWIDTNQVQFPLVVLMLLFPAILLGRWFKST